MQERGWIGNLFKIWHCIRVAIYPSLRKEENYYLPNIKKRTYKQKKKEVRKQGVYKYSKFYEMKSALLFPRKYVELKTKTLQICVQYTHSVFCVASSLLIILLICPFILPCRIPIKETSALYYWDQNSSQVLSYTLLFMRVWKFVH